MGSRRPDPPKPRLNWFSPLPPERSEIANVSARMLPVLAARFDLHLLSEAMDTNPQFADFGSLSSIHSGNFPWKRLNCADHSVYHVGNNVHFHGQIIEAARRAPGIVVLHDLALIETVINTFLQRPGGRLLLMDCLRELAGPEAVELTADFIDSGRGDPNTLAQRFPLHAYALANPTGVITHNPVNISPIRDVTQAPILFAPLPYAPSKDLLPPVPHPAPPPNAPLELVFFGFLGSSNRRLLPFLEVLAQHPLRQRFHVHLAGAFQEKPINAFVAEHGLKRQVTRHGFLPDADLDALLSRAHLCINLRWPSRGESSATLLRAWNASLPVLLTRTAFYASVPEEAAAFVNPAQEARDLNAFLSAFAQDPASVLAKGQVGHTLLRKEHTAERFVQHFAHFLPEVEAYRGRAFPHILARHVARAHIAEFPIPSARKALVERVAAELASW